jgi:hypothetical protein
VFLISRNLTLFHPAFLRVKDELILRREMVKKSDYLDWEYVSGKDPVGLATMKGLGKHIKVKRNICWPDNYPVPIHYIALDPNLKNLATGYHAVTGDFYDCGPGLLDYLRTLNIQSYY